MTKEQDNLRAGYRADNEAASAAGNVDRTIRAAAVASGIKDILTLEAIDATLIKLDEHGRVTNAYDVVKELRGRRPLLFHKPARIMTPEEYEEARRRNGISRRSSSLI